MQSWIECASTELYTEDHSDTLESQNQGTMSSGIPGYTGEMNGMSKPRHRQWWNTESLIPDRGQKYRSIGYSTLVGGGGTARGADGERVEFQCDERERREKLEKLGSPHARARFWVCGSQVQAWRCSSRLKMTHDTAISVALPFRPPSDKREPRYGNFIIAPEFFTEAADFVGVGLLEFDHVRRIVEPKTPEHRDRAEIRAENQPGSRIKEAEWKNSATGSVGHWDTLWHDIETKVTTTVSEAFNEV
ncbi:hypothetical protein B0H10DRAFT_1943303 [Mycena sp. CBHHK59/15]|nr:hypothetical protein B0H10DRAFT_1943303 [Mycena sp. CBHHK59/15]